MNNPIVETKVNINSVFCPLCEQEHSQEIREKWTSSLVKNEVVEHIETVYYCPQMNEEFASGPYVDLNLMRARDAYRQKHHLLTSAEIKIIRSKLHLTQKEFAFLLGLGEVTIVRYETTHIQDKNYDDMLRRADVDYAFLLQKLEDNHSLFSENRFNEIQAILHKKNTNHFIDDYKRIFLKRYYVYEENSELSGFTALDTKKASAMVAFFAKKVAGLAKVKLNKLLWYSDALAFLKNGHSISGLVYQHLLYGAVPVGSEELIRFAPVKLDELEFEDGHSACLITFSDQHNYQETMESLSSNEKELLTLVIIQLSHFSGPELSEIMHKERAYVETKSNEMIPFTLADPLLAFHEIHD